MNFRIHGTAKHPSYWMIDIKKRSALVFSRPESGEYKSQLHLTSDQTLELLDPAIRIDLAAIFSALDC